MWRIQAIHFSFLENSSTFFFGSEEIWFNQVGFSEFFLGGFKPGISLTLLRRWGFSQVNGLAGESIIDGTTPPQKNDGLKQGQRIVIILGECFHDVTICQHTQLDLEDESTGRSYPVSSSTPERGLSQMMHTVEKMAIINPQNMECRCCTTQLMAEQSTMNAPAKTF